MRCVNFIFISLVCAVASAPGTPILSIDEATKLEVYTPQPEYPLEARARRIQGEGRFILRVQIRTGIVKVVQIERSTGSSLLDSAAIRALKQWRFKPGVLPSIKIELPRRQDPFAKEDSFVRVPINFVMRR